MSGSSTPFRHRQQEISKALTLLLHPDVIPLVLGYEATLSYHLVGSVGGQRGNQDGEMDHPLGITLWADELLVVDSYHHQIQVFHQGTGRFLRRWGQYGRNDGEFELPVAAAIATDAGGKEEVFVVDCDRNVIQMFRLSDSQFLKRFPLGDRTGSASGIALMNNHIFVSQSRPNQIDVISRSEGKRLRIFGGWPLYELHPSKLFLEQESNHLFVCDIGDHCVKVIDLTTGEGQQLYGGNYGGLGVTSVLDHPWGVVVHGEEVIVCDRFDERLVVFDRSTKGLLRTIDDIPRMLSRKFSKPSDVAINTKNQLFVCDSGNARVLIFE